MQDFLKWVSHADHLWVLQFLKNPGKYKSVSAYAPIANPVNCQWGQKAFEGYFGTEEKAKWADHDATELVKKWSGEPLDILIDVVRSPSSSHNKDQHRQQHGIS